MTLRKNQIEYFRCDSAGRKFIICLIIIIDK